MEYGDGRGAQRIKFGTLRVLNKIKHQGFFDKWVFSKGLEINFSNVLTITDGDMQCCRLLHVILVHICKQSMHKLVL